MTATTHGARLPYDDLATPHEMYEDCRAAGENLSLPNLAHAAQMASAPAPSIRFEDYPREVVKKEIEVSDAAARLASALHLHLD